MLDLHFLNLPQELQNKQMYNLIATAENSPLSHTIATINDDRCLVYVNDVFVKQTGYARDEIVGQNCRFLQGKDTDPTMVQTIRKALK